MDQSISYKDKEINYMGLQVKKPHEMSDEELLKNEKYLKLAITMSVIAALLMLATGIYLTLSKGKFNAIAAASVAMVPLVLINAMNLKAVRTEKKGRSL
ncbi:hypothetical protein BWI93_10955 [Siphonobacter sp. BAB-5385]|uniref:hypothetical protein n=1 Tax=Siphonobacter sp. BAB-5385 TaxID=1864822 RepID=UPI000B9E36FF|nr:hypothetical protein [Siphonobacter sp. BAB-5385]OZI08124.1 hypothetical protein BWI93_10955 [Siphonobacter sp. BAB-5385]